MAEYIIVFKTPPIHKSKVSLNALLDKIVDDKFKLFPHHVLEEIAVRLPERIKPYIMSLSMVDPAQRHAQRVIRFHAHPVSFGGAFVVGFGGGATD